VLASAAFVKSEKLNASYENGLRMQLVHEKYYFAFPFLSAETLCLVRKEKIIVVIVV
jgi:hypothetical protein